MLNRKNRESNLAARILLTLHLAERRGYGLNILHLSNTLLGGEIPKEAVFRELQAMPEVVHHDGIYCLKGSESLLPETKRRLLCNGAAGARYETEAHLFASEYASLCPFVKCIAIAGSMASGGFSEEDDIDFNIFVEQECKYTVYLIEIILSLKYAFKHRKKPLGRKSRTPLLPKLICINVIWEDAEALPYVRQDAYIAYELLRQKPVLGLDFYRQVLEKNRWLEAYFPQIYDRDSNEVRVKKTFTARVLRLIYSNPFISHLGRKCAGRYLLFSGDSCSSRAGITLKHSRVSGG